MAYVLSGSKHDAEDLTREALSAAYVDPGCVDGLGRLQSI